MGSARIARNVETNVQILTKWVIPIVAGLLFVWLPYSWCRRHGLEPEAMGLSWKMTKRAKVECWIAIAAVLIPLSFIAVNWPYETLPRKLESFRAMNLAFSGIGAAFIEEVFFRGFIYPLFRMRFRPALSVIFASAIFAAAHIFVAQTVFLFAVFVPGCIMAILRERHGNIGTSTMFHAVCNFWAVWMAPTVYPTVEELLAYFS